MMDSFQFMQINGKGKFYTYPFSLELEDRTVRYNKTWKQGEYYAGEFSPAESKAVKDSSRVVIIGYKAKERKKRKDAGIKKKLMTHAEIVKEDKKRKAVVSPKPKLIEEVIIDGPIGKMKIIIPGSSDWNVCVKEAMDTVNAMVLGDMWPEGDYWVIPT